MTLEDLKLLFDSAMKCRCKPFAVSEKENGLVTCDHCGIIWGKV